MKVCPKCNSSYSDETLNFCLADGIPLVAEEILIERLSTESSWQTAETLHDGNLQLPRKMFSEHITSPNSASSLTSSDFKTKTSSFSTVPKKSWRPVLLPILGTILTIGVIGGIFWWLYTDKSSTNGISRNPNQTGEKTSTVKKAIVPLTPDQENQVKKEIADLLNNWKTANEKKDIESHINNYADTLQIYYGESGIDKNHVRADRLRAYQKYDTISLQVDKLTVTPESTESATAVFDKSWTMKNDKKTSTGSVQQELHMSKANGKWLIDSEKDLKVYFINNRENADANDNSPSNQ